MVADGYLQTFLIYRTACYKAERVFPADWAKSASVIEVNSATAFWTVLYTVLVQPELKNNKRYKMAVQMESIQCSESSVQAFLYIEEKLHVIIQSSEHVPLLANQDPRLSKSFVYFSLSAIVTDKTKLYF